MKPKQQFYKSTYLYPDQIYGGYAILLIQDGKFYLCARRETYNKTDYGIPGMKINKSAWNTWNTDQMKFEPISPEEAFEELL